MLICSISVVYAPAVAIEKVCNVPKNVAIAIMGVVCCVYTSLGGIKVMLNDPNAIQSSL